MRFFSTHTHTLSSERVALMPVSAAVLNETYLHRKISHSKKRFCCIETYPRAWMHSKCSNENGSVDVLHCFCSYFDRLLIEISLRLEISNIMMATWRNRTDVSCSTHCLCKAKPFPLVTCINFPSIIPAERRRHSRLISARWRRSLWVIPAPHSLL